VEEEAPEQGGEKRIK